MAFVERHKQAALSDLRIFGDSTSDLAETARYDFQYWAGRQQEFGGRLSQTEIELLNQLQAGRRKQISAEDLRRRVPN
ncbi:hypothetical protein, partial [Ciceribacter ferrooxidans]|uniref:hypothetical protein n=1 Tax=Ciceribacter ferrooxidans TaxID=2509717 RepID=UPI00196B57E7